MIPQDITQPLKDTLGKANDVLVLLPQNAGQEMVASALGLHQVLVEAGKNVLIASPSKLSESSRALPGAEAIADKIGNRNLVISLKVDKRDSIDKVSYNLDETDQVFNLIIQPKQGNPPLKKDQVSFSYSGAQADLIFTVGANRLEDLGEFYEAERKLFTDTKTVAINRYQSATFADFQITDTQASGHAELTYELVKALNLSLTAPAATAFLIGIDLATNNLSHPTMTADTLERVATLLRAGGVRQAAKIGLSSPSMPQPKIEPVIAPAQPQVIQPVPTNGSTTSVPQDWLQPKIYKSSTPSGE